jgi:hypothetical protein
MLRLAEDGGSRGTVFCRVVGCDVGNREKDLKGGI